MVTGLEFKSSIIAKKVVFWFVFRFWSVHLFVVDPESFFQLLLHLLLVVLDHEFGGHLKPWFDLFQICKSIQF